MMKKGTSHYRCPSCGRFLIRPPAEKVECPYCKKDMVETKKGVMTK